MLPLHANARKFGSLLLLMTFVGVFAGTVPFVRFARFHPALLFLGPVILLVWTAACAGLVLCRRWSPVALLFASVPVTIPAAAMTFLRAARGAPFEYGAWLLALFLLFYLVLAYFFLHREEFPAD